MANIDRADWHYGGNYPKDLPQENAGTHIGIYLAWVLLNGLGSAELTEYIGSKADLVKKRQITGRELLFSDLDEKFFPSLLSKEGNAFTTFYYASNQYFSDYDATLGGSLPSLYHVVDNWDNYDKMAPVITKKLELWRAKPSS